MNAEKLRKRIDNLLIKVGGKTFITSKPENILYFSGFTGDGILVLGYKSLHIITYDMFEEQVYKEVDSSVFNIHITKKDKTNSLLVDVLLENESEEICISSQDTTVGSFVSVIEAAKDRKIFGVNKKLISLRDDHFAVGGIKIYFPETCPLAVRAVKDREEIEIIKRNLLLSDESFLYTLRIVKPGMTEIEVAAEFEYYSRKKGAEGVSFPTIVASGPMSSMPHATASSRVIGNNEPIVMDFGIKLDGYCTDTTRTIFVGKPDNRFVETYKVVLDAMNEGIAVIKEGVKASDVDSKVRGYLAKYSLDKYFIHGTGHGVGLEVHELPTLNASSNDVLKEGMIVTVEPGVYFKNEFGIRIENMVLVNKNSSEILTTLPTDLLVV
jgi:Xaa-Pro aminopeptidase